MVNFEISGRHPSAEESSGNHSCPKSFSSFQIVLCLSHSLFLIKYISFLSTFPASGTSWIVSDVETAKTSPFNPLREKRQRTQPRASFRYHQAHHTMAEWNGEWTQTHSRTATEPKPVHSLHFHHLKNLCVFWEDAQRPCGVRCQEALKHLLK